MTAGPKGVAGRPDSLPAQQIAADPLQSYCPDLDQWPGSWAYEKRDIPPGLQMVDCFKPFLRELLTLSLSRQTLRRHRDNIWVLGGEVIRRLQMDSSLRRQPIQQVVLDLTEAATADSTDGFAAAAELACQQLDPEPDIHATADYRRHLAGVLTRRALLEALGEAQVRGGAGNNGAGRAAPGGTAPEGLGRDSTGRNGP